MGGRSHTRKLPCTQLQISATRQAALTKLYNFSFILRAIYSTRRIARKAAANSPSTYGSICPAVNQNSSWFVTYSSYGA